MNWLFDLHRTQPVAHAIWGACFRNLALSVGLMVLLTVGTTICLPVALPLLIKGRAGQPVDWFRFGLVGQRTRAYQTDVDIQRGLLVGFSYKKSDFTTYVFNLDQGKPTWVFAVGVCF